MWWRRFTGFIQKFGRDFQKTKSHSGNTLTRFRHSNFPKYCVLAPGSICLIAFTQKTKRMTEEQNLQSVLDHADQLFDENHFQEAYDTLSKYQDQSLSDVNWRKARALYQLTKTAKDKQEKEKLVRESYDLIKSAIKNNETDFACHKWMAVILDAYAELDGLKSRISQLDVVLFHMKKAVELNPNDPTSWYLLGSFEFSLADLPWIQRKIVSTIFATPPTGSYDKALEYFKKAEELKEGFYSMNWLMLGKTYHALKDNENAKYYLEKAANCQVLNEDDKNCKEEAQKWLKKF